MIIVLQLGKYTLEETGNDQKVLTLDNKNAFLWTNTKQGVNLEFIKLKSIDTCCLHAFGTYRLYSVKDEPDLTSGLHISFHAGRGIWRGFLLPKGFPNKNDKKKKIQITNETITVTKKKKS